ncbi:MAG: hypothetical protein MUO77_09520 [Anaerolineales bacterium]|nr:hypothetical protein [Anaerolineales bacterium]
MTTVDFKLSLPDQLRKEAEAAGLLILREEIRRRVDDMAAEKSRLASAFLFNTQTEY